MIGIGSSPQSSSRGASKNISRYVVLATRRSKGVLPVPTTVIRPCITVVPSKWVSQPRERRGSRCSRTAGKVEMPSVFMSIKRMRGILGLTSKTPLRVVLLGEVVLLDDVLSTGVIWLGVFCFERIEIIGLI